MTNDTLMRTLTDAGHWKAYVTDSRPGKRRGETIPRVLRIHGAFGSEEEAMAAAKEAIAAGWVAEHMVHRETAKAHADFCLPQQEINLIGRHASAFRSARSALSNPTGGVNG